jgi:hypothetical protein
MQFFLFHPETDRPPQDSGRKPVSSHIHSRLEKLSRLDKRIFIIFDRIIGPANCLYFSMAMNT